MQYAVPVTGHNYQNGICLNCGEDIAIEGLEFTVNDDGQSYSVTGLGKRTDPVVTIPATYKGLPVTGIASGAFEYRRKITGITIPYSVTSIGERAFYECRALEMISVDENNKAYHIEGNCLIETESKTLILACKNSVIPTDGSITRIGAYAFWRRLDITDLIIPNGVTSIGNYAFFDCENLADITLPYGVKSIGDWAFCDCVKLNDITIPDGITSIGAHTFDGCRGLTGIAIPNSVTSIGAYAFRSCDSLTSIIIPDSVTSIGAYAFDSCDVLTEVTLSKNITHIGDWTFYCCWELRKIVIPDGVTGIGEQAFYDCQSLTDIIIPKSIASIGDSAFANCRNIERITVNPSNKVYHSEGNCLIETESKTLILGCKNSIIPADGSVTRIGNAAFKGCRDLTDITIPDCVISIGDSAINSERDFRKTQQKISNNIENSLQMIA